MKKLTHLIAIYCSVTFIFLATSCKADVQHSNLTKSTWKLNDGLVEQKVVESHTYTDATPNTTTTQKYISTFTSSTESSEMYQLTEQVGSPDFFTRNISDFIFEMTSTFNQDGSCDVTMTHSLVSTGTESTGSPLVTVPVDPVEQVFQSSNSWSLINNNSTQTYIDFTISFFAFGDTQWKVEILDENKFVISINLSTVEVSHPSSTEIKTVTTSNSYQFNWGH